MQDRTSNTVLLVFSLSARSEAARKRVFGRYQKWAAHRFFEALIKQTRRIAQECGIDVAWVDEHEQVGSDFGERLGNAFQTLFAQGYENVISIGNDSPELCPSTIPTTIKKLDHQQLVLGPTLDGGAYLIGMNKALFEYREFCALPWQQGSLYQAFRDMAAANFCNCFSFDTLDDIDDQASAVRFALRNPLSELSTIIRSFLTFAQIARPVSYPNIAQNHVLSHPLRGPPTHI